MEGMPCVDRRSACLVVDCAATDKSKLIKLNRLKKVVEEERNDIPLGMGVICRYLTSKIDAQIVSCEVSTEPDLRERKKRLIGLS